MRRKTLKIEGIRTISSIVRLTNIMLTIYVQIRPHHNLADTIIVGTRYIVQMSRDSHTGNTANIGRTTVSIGNTLLLYCTP